MEKEVSHSVEIAVTLVILSVVISFVFYTVVVGNMVKEDGYDFAHRLQVNTSETFLADMVGKDNIMPTATAYNILKTYGAIIPQYRCNISNENLDLTKDQVCLVTHLTGKVSLDVVKLAEGSYSVTVNEYTE